MAREAFPLHVLVWNNQYLELELELQKDEVSKRGSYFLYFFVALAVECV